MGVLALLQPDWVLPAALIAAGLVFLLDVLAADPNGRGAGARFALDVVALPAGVVVLLATYVRWAALGIVPAAIAVAVGAILIGRSLLEVPWTGVAALVAAALVAYLLETRHPLPLSTVEVAIAAGIVFVLVYAILYLVEIPLRIAGLAALPRPFLAVLGAAALVGAALAAA
ncbi:MAG: hypothetical protein L3K16_09900 [Thermoplasmata archaeon]|nr:hypothetical protein [Thermoplasmata archaeon]